MTTDVLHAKTSRPVTGQTRGAALALLLLLIMALSGLGTGVLALARRQALAARTTEWVLQARLSAEAGLLSLAGAWPEGVDALLPGEELPGPTLSLGEVGSSSTTIRRLASELILVHSAGRRVPGPATSRVAALVWVLRPAARLGAQGAVVVSGQGLTTQGDPVDGTDTHRVPPGWEPARCDGVWEAVDSLFPTGAMPAFRPLTAPGHESPWGADGTLRPFDLSPIDGEPGLGMIPLGTLVEVAAPVGEILDAGLSCSEPPDESGLSCGRAPGIWGGTGELDVSEGSAFGILAVDGGLTLRGNARFSGWIIASGDVHLRDEASVYGVVRAGGTVGMATRASLNGSPCAALLALESPWLGNPRKMPDFSHLGPLSER